MVAWSCRLWRGSVVAWSRGAVAWSRGPVVAGRVRVVCRAELLWSEEASQDQVRKRRRAEEERIREINVKN